MIVISSPSALANFCVGRGTMSSPFDLFTEKIRGSDCLSNVLARRILFLPIHIWRKGTAAPSHCGMVAFHTCP